MDKQLIKEKLALSKSKKMVECKSSLEVVHTLWVAKKGSEYFLPYMALLQGEKNYVVFYTKVMPKGWDVENTGRGRGWYSLRVTDDELNVMNEAIKSYKDCANYHTQPYSHLIAYCLGKGLDLVEKGIINI